MSESGYTLVQQLEEASRLEAMLVESGGELTPEIEARLLTVDLNVASRVDAVHTLLARFDAAADYWTERANESLQVADALKAAHKRLKEHVKKIMIDTGRKDLPGEAVRYKLSNAKAKLIVDETQLERDYLKERVTYSPDQEKIRADIELGVPVKGAFLEPAYTLRPYPNKKALPKETTK